ncbi:single-stranded DNA-binding protein [Clostridioides sp. ZZV14-6045]|uniref:single-stranded DNA-binding protein n=1 Tax=unclassified Clostridioides TaxID=2635829 RepID=UPI001D0F770E|nr:single-stranded DNA-binding protein [Clostridioides sp. ZZV14-6045]MCC0732617.1 single-stranded DNA-binding protein [Clostridioides sp. ZZV14-6048]
MNNTILIGRLTKDPELKYLPGSGIAVTTFTIAIDRDYKKKDGTKETDFIPIEVMGKTAEYCANYIAKGDLVALQGSIRVNNYQTQEGEKKVFTKVNTNSIKRLAASNKEVEKEYKFEPEAVDVFDSDLPF